MDDDFFLTNLELRESTETGEQAAGLSHASMKGMVLLSVLELAARGEPRGAVTVLHDAGDTGARYRELALALAQSQWAVALPDLRGHGQTEGDRGHSAGLKEVWRDVQEIQDHLAYRMPDNPKVVVGQGLGALYGLSFALAHPGVLAGLVLVAPLHEPRFGEPEPPRGLKKLFNKVTPRSPGRVGYGGADLTRDAAEAAAWSSHAGTHDVITLRAIEEARRAAREALPRIADVDVPVLVVHGADDPLASVEHSRALAREGVTVQVFEGMRHHPLQEVGRAAVFAALNAWLDEVLPPG
jgi:lysophospholipase